MADGQVTVRFSVQDEETVRKALDNLGKDGEAALRKLDAAAKQPSQGLNALDKLIAGFKERIVGVGLSLGPAGTALIALGPAGVAAAAGVGAVIAIIEKLNEESGWLAEQAAGIKNFADSVTLSTNEVQALVDAGARLGQSPDKVRGFVEKFTTQMEQLRRGTGDLLDQITRIDPALAQQIAQARDTGEAWDLVARAYRAADQAGDTYRRNAIARAIGGQRGGLGAGAMLGITAEAGGLQALTQEQIQEGSILSPETVDRLSKMKTEIEQTNDRARKLIDSLFADDILARQRDSADILDRMARAMKDMADKAGGSWWKAFWTQSMEAASTGLPPTIFTDAADEQAAAAQQARLDVLIKKQKELNSDLDFFVFKSKEADNPWAYSDAQKVKTLEIELANVNKQIDAIRSKRDALQITINKAGEQVPLPPSRPQAPASSVSAEFELNRPGGLRDQVALLGQAATPAERLKLKLLELAAAQEKHTASSETATRALGAEILLELQQTNAIRDRLGVVTEGELQLQRSRELDDAQAKRFILNADERAQAERIVAKEVRNTVEAMQVRGAQFPALKQLEIDASHLDRTLDQELAGSLRSTTGDIIDMAKGTETASQGLGKMGMKLLEAAANAALLKSFVQPASSLLQSGLSSILSGFNFVKSADGNVFSGQGISAFSNQIITRPTMFAFANGAGLMGEAGDEGVLPLRRTSRGQLGVSAVGAGGQVINNFIVENHTSARVSERKTPNNSGGVDHRVIITDVVTEDIAGGGPVSRALERQFGLNRAAGAFG